MAKARKVPDDDLTPIQAAILRGLAMQAEDYLAAPHSSVFVSQLLDPVEVEANLKELGDRGLVTLDEAVQTYEVKTVEMEEYEETYERFTANDGNGSPEKVEETVTLSRPVETVETREVVEDVGWRITAEGRKALGE